MHPDDLRHYEERGETDVRIAVFGDIHSNYHAFKACIINNIIGDECFLIFHGNVRIPGRLAPLFYKIKIRPASD